jgi:hypothetical protein
MCKERGIRGYSDKKKSDIIDMLHFSCYFTKSPLRYPGGKTRAVKTLNDLKPFKVSPRGNIQYSKFSL